MVGLNSLGVFDTGLINELFADDVFQDNYVMPHKSAATIGLKTRLQVVEALI